MVNMILIYCKYNKGSPKKSATFFTFGLWSLLHFLKTWFKKSQKMVYDGNDGNYFERLFAPVTKVHWPGVLCDMCRYIQIQIQIEN